MGEGGLSDVFQCYPSGLGKMLPVVVRWVQMYLYSAATPALRVGSVLPSSCPCYCGSFGRYQYTVRSDWALLLCYGFRGWYFSYRCPPIVLLVCVDATVIDVGRS